MIWICILPKRFRLLKAEHASQIRTGAFYSISIDNADENLAFRNLKVRNVKLDTGIIKPQ